MSATTIIVNDESPRAQYTATAGQAVFDFPYPFFEKDDLVVYLTPAGQVGDDTDDLLTLTTDYTVTGEDTQNGGEVTLVVAASLSDTITIERVVGVERLTDYQTSGDLLAETINREQDTFVFIAQQLRANIDRGVRFQATASQQTAVIDAGVTGRALIWDANGNITNSSSAFNDIVTDAQTAQTAAELAETNAETAEANAVTARIAAQLAQTNAETAETNAETAEANAEASAGAIAFQFAYNNTTTMADPGTGLIRLNNAALASVTAIAIDDLANDTGNPDISGFITSWADLAGTPKGTLVIRKSGAPATFAIYNLTGLTDNTGWTQLAVTHVASNGSLTNADNLYLYFVFKGEDGNDGADALPVADSTSLVEGTGDATKELRIEVDGLTTATVRVWTAQDADLTVAGTDVTQTFTAAQRGEVTTLTSTTNSVAINLADSNNFSHTLTENTTLAAPSNAVEGQSGVITIVQDATTARTLAYNTFWEFEGGTVPAISTTLSSRSTFVYYVDDGAATATCNLIGPVS